MWFDNMSHLCGCNYWRANEEFMSVSNSEYIYIYIYMSLCGYSCTAEVLIGFEAWAKLAQKWLVCVCHWEYILSQLTKS